MRTDGWELRLPGSENPDPGHPAKSEIRDHGTEIREQGIGIRE